MVYRDAEEALRQRREELLAERRRELEGLTPRTRRVYVRRQARRVAGLAGVISAACLGFATACRWRGLTDLLLTAWLVMAVAWALGWGFGYLHLRRALARALCPGDDAGDDVDRLTETSPAAVVAELAARAEAGSVALPMTAFALLAPLSLHYLAIATLRMRLPTPHDFDGWIAVSLLLVGHCHLVLAYQVCRFARAAGTTTDPLTLGLLADRSAWHAWGITVASSVAAGALLLLVVPLAGVALLVIAPVLVAATGMAFIPTMYERFGRWLRNERLSLASASCKLRRL